MSRDARRSDGGGPGHRSMARYGALPALSSWVRSAPARASRAAPPSNPTSIQAGLRFTSALPRPAPVVRPPLRLTAIRDMDTKSIANKQMYYSSRFVHADEMPINSMIQRYTNKGWNLTTATYVTVNHQVLLIFENDEKAAAKPL